MTGWLLDTNILSELRRSKPNASVLTFVAAQPLDSLYVSAVTFAEIRFSIELVADPTRRTELNEWLIHEVRPMFGQRVLPVTEDVMFRWRLMVEDGRKARHTFSQPDLIIVRGAKVWAGYAKSGLVALPILTTMAEFRHYVVQR